MKYSVCIDMMFSHAPFYDRFSLVKESGIDAVEFWKWSNKDIPRVCELLCEHSLKLSIFNIDCKNQTDSHRLSRGILNSGSKELLIRSFYESLPVYKKLNASGMIVLIGEELGDLSHQKQTENIIDTLCAIKPLAEAENVTLLVEPLNATDRSNYFMPYSKPLYDILKAVDSDNIKMLFDIYHQQMTEGHILQSIGDYFDKIGHFHVADCPGRHEPGTGELNYPSILSKIKSLSYDKYIGLEYRATKDDKNTLGFISEVMRYE